MTSESDDEAGGRHAVDEYLRYIREMFFYARKDAAAARRKRIELQAAGKTSDAQFQLGIEAGCLLVIQRMQIRAPTCMIDPRDVGMDSFDPLVDELEPDPGTI